MGAAVQRHCSNQGENIWRVSSAFIGVRLFILMYYNYAYLALCLQPASGTKMLLC